MNAPTPPEQRVIAESVAVHLTVWRDNYTGGLQLEIGDETGGYRIAGPKFMGDSEKLLTRKLDKRDVAEIRLYLERTDG